MITHIMVYCNSAISIERSILGVLQLAASLSGVRFLANLICVLQARDLLMASPSGFHGRQEPFGPSWLGSQFTR
jgi:hypothetical protein